MLFGVGSAVGTFGHWARFGRSLSIHLGDNSFLMCCFPWETTHKERIITLSFDV